MTPDIAKLRAALESALRAPRWAECLSFVHDAIALLPNKAPSDGAIYSAVSAKDAREALALLPQKSERRWQHVKRGSTVTEIGRGFAQVAAYPIEEMTAVVLYRHDADGTLWVRNAVEFDDGRFVSLTAPPASQPAEVEVE